MTWPLSSSFFEDHWYMVVQQEIFSKPVVNNPKLIATTAQQLLITMLIGTTAEQILAAQPILSNCPPTTSQLINGAPISRSLRPVHCTLRKGTTNCHRPRAAPRATMLQKDRNASPLKKTRGTPTWRGTIFCIQDWIHIYVDGQYIALPGVYGLK